MPRYSASRLAFSACLVLASLAGAARADEPSNADLIRDYVHFVRIARYDVAASYGRQLLDRGLSPTEFVDLLESTGESARFQESIARQVNPEIEAISGELLKHYERGKLIRVRDPQEVSRNIRDLTENARARQYARERLAAAGEYAMPQLLAALLQRDNPELRAQVQSLMIDMGRQAVMPLCAALPHLDATGQEAVADILGLIPYKTSLPFLVDVRAGTTDSSVRSACDRAIERLRLDSGLDDAAWLYTVLGNDFYAEKLDVTSFPDDPHQVLWSYDPGAGLIPTAIATPVYHEAMAMRLAERSLTLRPAGNQEALALWLASNFSREIDTPDAYTNPAYAADRRDAMYYAVAAGAGPSQRVLARGLDDRDTNLVRRAIAAIEKTAGGSTILSVGGDASRNPLIEALQYPNRRVRYEAALALGASQPQSSFNGADRVVPTLASAVRDASARFAVVLASDSEEYGTLRGVLERAGYTVLPSGRSIDELAAPIAQAPGIDFMIVSLAAEQAEDQIEQARRSPSLLATPILALGSSQSFDDLRRRYSRTPGVAVRQAGITAEMIASTIGQLSDDTGGLIDADAAGEYQSRSLAVLRDLAVAANPVLDVADAALPLITSMGEAKGPTKLRIADVLARVNQKRAQVAVMDAAIAADGDERVALLGIAAESAKRFGSMLDERQVSRVIEMARTGSDAQATAAAALMGALSLPNQDLIPIILGEK